MEAEVTKRTVYSGYVLLRDPTSLFNNLSLTGQVTILEKNVQNEGRW